MYKNYYDAAKSVSLAAVISKFFNLDYNVERNKLGVCPLCGGGHSTGCFSLYSTKGEYLNKFKCFSCGEGGDAIDLTAKAFNISQTEAAKQIAEAFGLEVEENTLSVDPQAKERTAVMNDLAKIFYKEYLKQENKFFADRGFSNELVVKKMFGYCPNNFLYNGKSYDIEAYLKLKYPKINIGDYGITSDNGYCILADRYVFPIRNGKGNVVAFSGRSIDKQPKYINSKNCAVYDKSKSLYGVEESYKYSSVYVVEGIADAASLQSAGVYNVVAPCGTALTKYQLAMLSGKEIILAFDNDDAGKSKMSKLIEENRDIKFKVLLIKDYKDFNEALMAGVDLNVYIKSSRKVNGVRFVIEYFKDTHDLSDDDCKDLLYSKVAKLIGGYSVYGTDERYPANKIYSPITASSLWRNVIRLFKRR